MQGRLDRARHLKRVGAVLAGQCQKHARLAHHQGVAKLRRRRFGDIRHVPEPDRQTAAGRDQRFTERRGSDRLPSRFHKNALRRCIYETAATDLRGGPDSLCYIGGCQSAREQRITPHAYFKAPGWVAFVDALPLTPTQKVQRGELKALAATLPGTERCIDTRSLKKRPH